jgi:hypothetical protein
MAWVFNQWGAEALLKRKRLIMGKAFPKDLDIRFIGNRKFKLLADFHYEIGGVTVVIPAGEETDLNSVPRICWAIVSPIDHPEVAIPHDHLYRTGKVSRVVADAFYMDGLMRLEPPVPKWKRWLMYLGVRCGGWHAYKQHERARKKAR